MNIPDVMDELGVALAAIAGLRVFPFNADKVNPPAAIVGWPDPLEYDQTMARGMDRQTLPLYVVVGKLDARISRDALGKYLNGSGDHSVKVAVEAGTYTACDTVRVTEATVNAYHVAGVEYLGAEFKIDVVGQGG